MIIDNFSGMTGDRNAGKSLPNELVNIVNMQISVNGMLTPIPGYDVDKITLNETSNADDTGGIVSHTYYSTSEGTTVIFAKRGNIVWKGVKVWGSSTVSWYPILADAYGLSSYEADYLECRKRSNVSKTESFAVIGKTSTFKNTAALYKNIYISSDEPSSADYSYCYSGKMITPEYIDVGIKVVGGTPSYAEASTSINWSDYYVEPGDILYICDNNQWKLSGAGTRGMVIAGVVSGNTKRLELDCNTAQTYSTGSTYVEKWCIVRVKRTGIKAPSAACTSANATGSFAWISGSYRWAYRYKDDRTGYTSNLSPASSPLSKTGTTTGVTVAGWTTTPPLYVSTIEVFRSLDGGLWNLIGEVTRKTVPWTGWYNTFSASFVDSAIVSLATFDNMLFLHDQPPALRGIYKIGDKLVSRGTHDDSASIRLSNLHLNNFWSGLDEGCEYFPTTQYASSSSTILPNAGGWIEVGDGTSGISAIVPEQGSYSINGFQGDGCIIITNSKAYRFNGYNWSDYRLSYLCDIDGCQAPVQAISLNGNQYWIGKTHIWALNGGQPQAITQKLFPAGIMGSMLSNSLDKLKRWSIGSFGDYLLVSVNNGLDTDNHYTYLFNISTHCCSMIDLGFNDFQQWNNSFIDDAILLTGSQAGTSNLTSLFINSEPVDGYIDMAMLWNSEAVRAVSIKSISVCIKPSGINYNNDMEVYAEITDANNNNVLLLPVNVMSSAVTDTSAYPNINPQREIVRFFPSQTFYAPSIRIGFNNMAIDTQVEWINIDSEHLVGNNMSVR